MIRRTVLLIALCLPLATAHARDVDVLPELVHVRDLAPEPPATARADTTWLLGGPGTLSGKFETVGNSRRRADSRRAAAAGAATAAKGA